MNIYEIIINLCKENLKKEINLTERINEISKSVNELNSNSKYVKQLLLLEVKLNNVVVLFRGNTFNVDEDENLKSINKFLSTLIMKYNWKDYLNVSGKKFFDVKIVKVHKSVSNNVFTDSTITNLKKYNSSHNINRFLMNVDLDELTKNIIGCEDFKKEIKNIDSYVKLNKNLNMIDGSTKKDLFPYHYLFTGEYGIDQYKMVKKFYTIDQVPISR
jgi:hypothetical protein